MENFETTNVITENTYIELKRFLKPPNEIRYVIIYSTVLLIIAIIGLIFQHYYFTAIGLGFGIGGPLFYIKQFNYMTRKNWKRMVESSGGVSELEVITTFMADGVKTYNKQSGGSSFINYNSIFRFAETDNIYALFTKENQFIVIDKISIEHEQKTKELINFLREKCINIKWSKVK